MFLVFTGLVTVAVEIIDVSIVVSAVVAVLDIFVLPAYWFRLLVSH